MPAARVLAVVLAIAPIGCARHRVKAPAPVATPGPEGKTSVRVLNTPAGSPDVETGPAERITPAYASEENKLPEYPRYALKAGCRGGIVAVRVHLDTEGNVSAQRDVPDHPLPADECHLAFRAAVQSAINGWKFAPSFRQIPYVDTTINPRGPVTRWRQEPIAIYVDFEFTFEVVAGKGIVRTR